MITLDEVCARFPGLSPDELTVWIERDWVRPLAPLDAGGRARFADVDVARVRLILELRTELEVEEPTVPLVLSLLDQLYAARAELRRVLDTLDEDGRRRLADRLHL